MPASKRLYIFLITQLDSRYMLEFISENLILNKWLFKRSYGPNGCAHPASAVQASQEITRRLYVALSYACVSLLSSHGQTPIESSSCHPFCTALKVSDGSETEWMR